MQKHTPLLPKVLPPAIRVDLEAGMTFVTGVPLDAETFSRYYVAPAGNSRADRDRALQLFRLRWLQQEAEDWLASLNSSGEKGSAVVTPPGPEHLLEGFIFEKKGSLPAAAGAMLPEKVTATRKVS